MNKQEIDFSMNLFWAFFHQFNEYELLKSEIERLKAQLSEQGQTLNISLGLNKALVSKAGGLVVLPRREYLQHYLRGKLKAKANEEFLIIEES